MTSFMRILPGGSKKHLWYPPDRRNDTTPPCRERKLRLCLCRILRRGTPFSSCGGVATLTELAYEVMRSWGFIPEGQIIWEKISSNGNPRIGLGGKVRYSHEILLIGHKGKPEKANFRTPSVITAKITKHSEKPEIFAEVIEKMFPRAKRIELFARRPRIGWTSVGNQILVGEEMRVSIAEYLT